MDKMRNSGQAYTEYVVVVLMVSLALLAQDESGQPYVGRLIDAIKQHYQGYATSAALPELPSNAHQ
jgi:hypothetical protein